MRTMHGFHINVGKDNLLACLRENMKRHAESHKEALVRYRAACIDRLTTRLKQLQDNEKVKPYRYLEFDLAYKSPKNYEHVYTNVIEMLEMHTDDTISLTNEQFRAWIKDEWEWSGEYAITVSSY